VPRIIALVVAVVRRLRPNPLLVPIIAIWYPPAYT